MVITPDSKIILLKSPLKLDNLNQITFTSLTNQYNYFYNLPKLEYDNCTYQRKDGVIRYKTGDDVNLYYEDLLKYNYCMYQNSHYSNKWFYAFIIDIKYVNDGMTEITIETDTFQTWQFDIEYKQSFVEREHVSDDTFGKHTLAEDLPTGDLISCKLQPSYNTDIETCFVLAVSELLTGSYSTNNQTIPSGLYYIGLTSNVGVRTYCEAYDKGGKGDAINSVFIAPKSFFSAFIENSTVTVAGTTYTITGGVSYNVDFNFSQNITVTHVNYLADEYYPRNNKTLCYPYSYLQVSNHNGTVLNYKWENFNMLLGGSDYRFTLRGTISPGCSMSAYPYDYNNILSNYDESINLGKYPIGGWNSDTYTNWLTQNGVNIAGYQLSATEAKLLGAGAQAVTGSISLGLGLTETGASQLANVPGAIFGALQDDYRHSLIPEQARGNTNVGDYSFQYGLTNLEFKRMSVKREYAIMIDDYFTLYGYKVNDVKTPQINSRLNWNYIKCIGVNLEGEIPESDLDKIRSLFNNGCTFWHNPDTFLNYTASNTIV